MTASAAPQPSDRLASRQITIWLVFTVLLVTGLVMYFRFANAFPPLLDVLIER